MHYFHPLFFPSIIILQKIMTQPIMSAGFSKR